MAFVLNRNQVREIDRVAVENFGMSGLVLMENAGRGAADVLTNLLGEVTGQTGPVVIVCGKGNNGGDGFVVARHLELRRYAVEILLLCDPADLRGDAATNYSILVKGGFSITQLPSAPNTTNLGERFANASYLVDAILGTGAQGDPRPPADAAIDTMNASGKPILALDLPSGLDCDTGEPALHTIRAAHTCTFVAAKPGLLSPSAVPFVGKLHICDIGIARRVLASIVGPDSPEERGPTSGESP